MNITPLKIAKQEAAGTLREDTVTDHANSTRLNTSSRSISGLLYAALLPGLISRGLVLAVLLLIAGLSITSVPGRESQNYLVSFTSSLDQLSNSARRIFNSADAPWYQQIAQSGYDRTPVTTTEPRNWVFFPLYPALLKAVAATASLLTGHPPFGKGFLPLALAVNFAAFLLSLVLVYRYSRLKGLDPVDAERAVWLLSFFPLSYFFTCPLTEAPFLLLLSASLLMLESKHLLLSAVAMSLAAVCRPVGLLMIPAFAVLLAEKRTLTTLRGWGALVISGAGILGFMGHLWILTGDPLAFVHNQIAWGRGQQGVLRMLTDLAAFQTPPILPWNFVLLNAASALLVLATSIWLFAHRELGLALLISLPIAFCIATGTLQSLGRFTATLVPVFLVLSLWCKNPRVERVVLILMAALLTLMTLAFAFQVTSAMA